jgi:hypothetical protein
MMEGYGVLEKRVFDSEVRFLGAFCFEPYNMEQCKDSWVDASAQDLVRRLLNETNNVKKQ